jgi:tetratricopeptide (TPR) repeat protein
VRRASWLALVAIGSLLLAAGARAASPVEELMNRSTTPSQLRAALLDYARTAPDSAGDDKAAALLHAGLSYERAGRADSALLCFERAAAARGSREDRDAFVDALLDRGNAEDPRRALEVLGPRLQQALSASERDIGQTRGRQAWAYYIMGRGDSALSILRTQQRWLLDPVTPRHRDWRYRLGLLELERGDPSTCIEVLSILALESRFQDRDVMGILRDASQKTSRSEQVGNLLKAELNRSDEIERGVLTAFRARRIMVKATDGTSLGAVVIPSLRRPARSAVVLMDPDELPESYDSLATGLSAVGYSLILVEPRGSGWSVSSACPLPSTWRGREDEMESLVARDVPVALRALAANAPADTSRYVVMAGLGSCGAAAQAANLDSRVRAVVLLSPSPSKVEIGPMRARLKASRAPVFFEVPVMDHSSIPLAEALYEGLDPRTSRITESEIVGSSAKIFRYDKSALPRLITWLDESWGAKGSAGKRGR